MFIYPENLKAKPMLWLWLLRDIAVIGIGALLSVLALTQGLGMGLLVVTVLYAFLTIQVDGSSILPEDIPVQRKNKNINNVLHDIGPFVVGMVFSENPL